MAQFCVEIPDDKVTGVIFALCGQYKYQSMVANESFDPSLPESTGNPRTVVNPETQFQFANRMTRQWIVENVKAWQAKEAAQAAKDSVLNSFDLEITDPAATGV